MNFLSGQDDFFRTGNQPISVRHLSQPYNKYIYIPEITYNNVPSRGYHHSGFMATPELGHKMCGLYVNLKSYLVTFQGINISSPRNVKILILRWLDIDI